MLPFVMLLVAFGGLLQGGLATFAGVVVIFALHPLLDLLFKDVRISSHRPSHVWANVPLYLSLPAMFCLLIFTLKSFAEYSSFEMIGAVVSVGALGGLISINMAHELVHRSSSWERALGYSNLFLMNLPHWGIEHVYGHHRFVGTFDDAATARRGESVYAFWWRNWWTGLLDARRIAGKKSGSGLAGMFKNQVHQMWLGQISILVGVLLLFGTWGLIFFIGQSVVACLLLFTVDYVEHYGLVRGKGSDGVLEPVKPRHSWDSYTIFTNYALVNLGLHSHHHMRPGVPYEKLEFNDTSHQMPFGYSTMVVLALVPPLFRKIVDPLLPSN